MSCGSQPAQWMASEAESGMRVVTGNYPITALGWTRDSSTLLVGAGPSLDMYSVEPSNGTNVVKSLHHSCFTWFPSERIHGIVSAPEEAQWPDIKPSVPVIVVWGGSSIQVLALTPGKECKVARSALPSNWRQETGGWILSAAVMPGSSDGKSGARLAIGYADNRVEVYSFDLKGTLSPPTVFVHEVRTNLFSMAITTVPTDSVMPFRIASGTVFHDIHLWAPPLRQGPRPLPKDPQGCWIVRSRSVLKGHDGAVFGLAWAPPIPSRSSSSSSSSSSSTTTSSTGTATALSSANIAQGPRSGPGEKISYGPPTALASVSDDRTLRIWPASLGSLPPPGHPAPTPSPLGIAYGHEARPWSVGWISSSRLVTVGEDGSTRLWSMNPTLHADPVIRAGNGGQRAWSVAVRPPLNSGPVEETPLMFATGGQDGSVAVVSLAPDTSLLDAGTLLADGSGAAGTLFTPPWWAGPDVVSTKSKKRAAAGKTAPAEDPLSQVDQSWLNSLYGSLGTNKPPAVRSLHVLSSTETLVVLAGAVVKAKCRSDGGIDWETSTVTGSQVWMASSLSPAKTAIALGALDGTAAVASTKGGSAQVWSALDPGVPVSAIFWLGTGVGKGDLLVSGQDGSLALWNVGRAGYPVPGATWKLTKKKDWLRSAAIVPGEKPLLLGGDAFGHLHCWVYPGRPEDDPIWLGSLFKFTKHDAVSGIHVCPNGKIWVGGDDGTLSELVVLPLPPLPGPNDPPLPALSDPREGSSRCIPPLRVVTRHRMGVWMSRVEDYFCVDCELGTANGAHNSGLVMGWELHDLVMVAWPAGHMIVRSPGAGPRRPWSVLVDKQQVLLSGLANRQVYSLSLGDVLVRLPRSGALTAGSGYHGRPSCAVTWHPGVKDEPSSFWSGGEDTLVRWWSLPSAKEASKGGPVLRKCLTGPTGTVRALSVVDQGSGNATIVSGGGREEVMIWLVRGNDVIAAGNYVSKDGEVRIMSLSTGLMDAVSGSVWILVGLSDGRVRLHHWVPTVNVWLAEVPCTPEVVGVGRADNGVVKVIGESSEETSIPATYRSSCVMSADSGSSEVLLGATDGSLRLWDVVAPDWGWSPAARWVWPRVHSAGINGVWTGMWGEERVVITGGDDGAVVVSRIGSGPGERVECARMEAAAGSAVKGVWADAATGVVVAGGIDERVTLFRLTASSTEQWELKMVRSLVTSVWDLQAFAAHKRDDGLVEVAVSGIGVVVVEFTS